ncbi:MAG: glycoside hydrolase family 13 protein [Streptosporangiaceae bacterium]
MTTGEADETAGAVHLPWWRDAVTYQVYIRSFADADGDGIGDVGGIRSRLPYLRDLGVDALWINPWYPSPMVDAGYDISDYRDIAPEFGTLAGAEALVEEAHAHGLRVVIDLVPNHTSDRHPWFQAALASPAGSPERARYWFRRGRGDHEGLPPTNWKSTFGGPAWTRVTGPDHGPDEWYLHLFTPEQPDLNWSNPEVREEFLSVIRFWFDRGVDGIRIDVAPALDKDPALPDLPCPSQWWKAPEAAEHPFRDRDGVLEIYRSWRALADEYAGDRAFVAEAWVSDPERVARYVRPGHLHTAFNFPFLTCQWDPARLREVVDRSLAAFGAVGAPATWVLSNHDVVRHVSRYGRTQAPMTGPRFALDSPFDLELGTRRARAAALLMLALPGGAYVYQGEELGLWEAEDLPEEALQDPRWAWSDHTDRGRDGCRVPLPWSGEAPPFGFGPDGSDPWLPQPAAWKDYTAETQDGDPASMLELYRAALALRRAHPALGDGGLRWLDSPEEVLAFARDPSFRCVVNLSADPSSLPPHGEVLLASARLEDGRLPTDAAIWLRA